MQRHHPPMTPRHRVFLAMTVLMVLTVIGLVIGCDSDDTPTVTAPAPSGGGNNGGNGQTAVEFDATATAKGQQCGSASSTEIRNTCSDVPLNVRVQCVTATVQPFGSVQHLRLAPGAAMPGDPLGCTGSGGETLQAPSLARSSHSELLVIRSNYCPDPYLYIYGDITNGRLTITFSGGTGGCIHPDKLTPAQRQGEMVPTEPTAPIPSFEEVKETKRYKPTSVLAYPCGTTTPGETAPIRYGVNPGTLRVMNQCPFDINFAFIACGNNHSCGPERRVRIAVGQTWRTSVPQFNSISNFPPPGYIFPRNSRGNRQPNPYWYLVHETCRFPARPSARSGICQPSSYLYPED